MQDRLNPKHPGRVLITPEDGSAPFYATMSRADEPEQPGTPLNKKTLLTDETAALYGMESDSLPDEVLAFLGQYAQHWWKFKTNEPFWVWEETRTPVDSSLTFPLKGIASGAAYNIAVWYYDSVVVDQTAGTVVPQGGTYLKVDSSNYTLLRGKYIKAYQGWSNDIVSNGGFSDDGLYYVPADVQVSEETIEHSFGDAYDTFTVVVFPDNSVSAISSAIRYLDGEVIYKQSGDRYAYPDSGYDDTYVYEYLGVPFENAALAPKMIYGAYVGTGVYGSSNQNTLSFDSEPYLVFFFTSGGFNAVITPLAGTTTTWDGASKTLSWYSTSDAAGQQNSSGTAYTYIAILR